jgi:hypothetical protein
VRQIWRPFVRKIPAPGPAITSIAAAIVAGVALWVSRASFDVAGTSAAPERVAMLPSLAELAGLIAAALLVAAGMAALLGAGGITEKRSQTPFWLPVSDALLPLFGLTLLILPYLPFIADWVPALRLLAGPLRLLIWVVVIGQVIWIFLPDLARRAGLPVVDGAKAAAAFALTAVFFSAPFVLNLRNLPTAFVDIFHTIGRVPSANLAGLPTGALGVLFDQEYGIVPFAPVLLLAVVGLAGMLADPLHRRLAMALSLATVLLVALPATLDPWWSRSAMPGEQLLLMFPLLVMPIAWLYARLPRESLSLACANLLLLVSIAISLLMVFFSDRVPVRQEADGTSGLLQWLSPNWQLWSEAPTYVVGGAGAAATLRVIVWLAVFGIASWIMSRRSTASVGRSALAATAGATLLFVAVVSATSYALSAPAKRFDVEGRVLFPLLETFDPVARPTAVRYDAFSIVSPAELPPLFTVSAVPGKRTDPQPLRVVLNARFRLPAGDYALDLTGSESAGTVPKAAIALQIGREGRPLETWPLALGRGERVRQPFQVPIDAEFVGFRASRQVEETIAELRVSALSVVDVRRRFRTPTVLSAAAFEPARLFFHDGNAYPERDGFWTKGRTTTQMTLMKTRETDPAVLLAVHSGARPNVVTLSTPDWSQKLELVPGVTERVVVPSREGQRFVTFAVTTSDGFVPAEIEASRDRRLLGAWIAFIPGDTSRTSAAP